MNTIYEAGIEDAATTVKVQPKEQDLVASIEEINDTVDLMGLDLEINETAGLIARTEAQLGAFKEAVAVEEHAQGSDVNSTAALMAISSTKTIASILGFPKEQFVTVGKEDAEGDAKVALDVAVEDKKSMLNKTIDYLRKMYIKLKMLVRKAMLKVVGLVGRRKSKLEDLQKQLKDVKSSPKALEVKGLLGDDKVEAFYKKYLGYVAFATGKAEVKSNSDVLAALLNTLKAFDKGTIELSELQGQIELGKEVDVKEFKPTTEIEKLVSLAKNNESVISNLEKGFGLQVTKISGANVRGFVIGDKAFTNFSLQLPTENISAPTDLVKKDQVILACKEATKVNDNVKEDIKEKEKALDAAEKIFEDTAKAYSELSEAEKKEQKADFNRSKSIYSSVPKVAYDEIMFKYGLIDSVIAFATLVLKSYKKQEAEDKKEK